MALFTRNLLEFLLAAIWILVIGRVIVSFVDPYGRNTISRYVIAATEWFLGPIRRALPPMGGLDLSPMIVIIVLAVVSRAVL